MSPETARLLQELRDAIHESLGSPEIASAISALARSGNRVLVSVDATLDMTETLSDEGGETPDPSNYSSDSLSEDSLELTPSDERFLLAMHIAVGREGSRSPVS
jgi:hypothetical protein